MAKNSNNEKKVLFAIEAQLLANFGSSITGFVLGLWIFNQEGSVTSLSLLYFFQSLPSLMFTYLSGVIVDSFSRKKILAICDILFFILLSMLLICYWLDSLSRNVLYGYVSLCTIVSIVQTIALGSLAGSMIDPEKRITYNTIINLRKTLPRLMAPLLAGFLILYVELLWLIIFNLITFLISLATICFLPEIVLEPRKKLVPIGKLEYFYYVFKKMKHNASMLYSVICMQFSLVYTSLLGVYVIPLALAKYAASTAGVLTACGGVGALLGSKYLTARYKNRPELFLPVSVIIQSSSIIICGMFMSPIFLAMTLFVHFFFVPTQNGCANTIWQNQVDQADFGKILSIQGIILQLTCIFALLIAGPVAEYVVSPLIQLTDQALVLIDVSDFAHNPKESSMYIVLFFIGVIGFITSIFLMKRTLYLQKPMEDSSYDAKQINVYL